VSRSEHERKELIICVLQRIDNLEDLSRIAKLMSFYAEFGVNTVDVTLRLLMELRLRSGGGIAVFRTGGTAGRQHGPWRTGKIMGPRSYLKSLALYSYHM